MTAFEQFLYDKGYRPYDRDYKKPRKDFSYSYVPITLEQANNFSSMGKLENIWCKPDLDIWTNAIYFGLHERHKPPTLISPLPNIKRKIVKLDGNVYYQFGDSSDDMVNIVLKTIPFEKIYEAMFDKTIVFTLPDLVEQPIVERNTGYTYQSPTCAY